MVCLVLPTTTNTVRKILINIHFQWVLVDDECIVFAGIDDDDSAVEDSIQPADEDMPVLEGDDDTSRMEEVD